MTLQRTPTLLFIPGLLACALLAGCAAQAVSEDAIRANTSRALGLAPSAFVISDRADSGLQTTYTARTQGGRTYSCYVEGTVSVVGRVVSDAICQEMRQTDAPARGAPARRAAPDPACNALLRAAGRCD